MRDWKFECVNVVKVKNYAPRVEHLVCDITLRPSAFVSDISVNKQISHPRIVKRCRWPETQQEVEKIVQSGHLVILTGCFTWELEKLLTVIAQNDKLKTKEVSVHVSEKTCSQGGHMLDFNTRNFKFKVFSLYDFLQQASRQPSKNSQDDANRAMYLRAVGRNFRKDRAAFWKDYPELIGDELPFLQPEEFVFGDDTAGRAIHSSVFRVATKRLNLWTHYDVMDNVLFQLIGTKRIILFPPDQIGNLYMNGSTSKVLNVQDYAEHRARIRESFPKFEDAMNHSYEVELCEGEALFIPELWPHNSKSQTFSVGVNVFFESAQVDKQFYVRKDLYGNRDPVNIEIAERLIEQAIEALEDEKNGRKLPYITRDFYATKLAAKLQSSQKRPN